MRESITGHSVFNTNKMLRSSDPRAVILLESDADQAFIGLHLRHEAVRCALGFSKSAVVLAAQLHAAADDDWVSAVVDRDYVPFEAVRHLYATSHYDLEAEAFFAARRDLARLAYAHVLNEENHDDVTADAVVGIVDEAIQVASTIGIVRAVSVHRRMELRVSKLPLQEIVRRAKSVDYITAVAVVACMRDGRSELTVELEDLVRSEIAGGRDLSILCCGHDLLGALAMLIKDVAGSKLGHRELTRSFHALVSCSIFSTLSIYDPLREWLLNATGSALWDCAA